MDKRLAITTLFSLLILSLCAQEFWTLPDCINYAKENNLQIQQSINSIENSEIDVKQAKAALAPSVSFSSQQQLGFQKIESQSYASFDAEARNPTYTGSYGVQANMTLYNGCANWRSLKQQKINRDVTLLEAQQTLNDIEIRIIEAYYQILYAHESVIANEEIVSVAERELERTNDRKEVGKASKVEVAQMESQLQQNRYQLLQSRNTESSNLLKLKQLLQLPPSSDFRISYEEISDDEVLSIIPTLQEAEEMAMNNLPDMKTAELRVKSSEMQMKIAKGGYQPKLSLNAGVSTNNGNNLTGEFPDQIRDHMRSTVGLSLSVPIYDQRSTRSSVEKAKIQHQNTQLEQENTKLQLQNTIASLHLEIQLAQSRYQSAVESEKSAYETFKMMDERYAVGLESMIDLLTEKNSYIKAKQETLQSKYNALLNQQILNFYIGK